MGLVLPDIEVEKRGLYHCLQITTVHNELTTQERQKRLIHYNNMIYAKKMVNKNEKKRIVLPSDNNSPLWTDYPRETELVSKYRSKFTLTKKRTRRTTAKINNNNILVKIALPSDNNRQ